MCLYIASGILIFSHSYGTAKDIKNYRQTNKKPEFWGREFLSLVLGIPMFIYCNGGYAPNQKFANIICVLTLVVIAISVGGSCVVTKTEDYYLIVFGGILFLCSYGILANEDFPKIMFIIPPLICALGFVSVFLSYRKM